jgi:hypothetical protein
MKESKQGDSTHNSNSSSSVLTCKKKVKEATERRESRARDRTEGEVTGNRTNNTAV